MGGKWEGNYDIAWHCKEMGRKKLLLLVGEGNGKEKQYFSWCGKEKEGKKLHEMSKTASKPYKNRFFLIKCPKMLKNTKNMGNFATTKDTKIKGKYQMPMGKGKGKREIPKTKRKRKRKREMPKPKGKREKEKGNTKIKREKEKGKGNIKYKREGKGREIDLFLPNLTGKRNSR